MKTMKVFIAGQEVFRAPLVPSDDPPGVMSTTVSNVRIEEGGICFDTPFGDFTGIGHDEDVFNTLKEAEASGKFLRINYTTK